MQARAALYELISGDADLALENVYPTNSVDTAPEDWFAVITWGVSTPSYGTTGADQVQIWLHDKQHDYGRINAGLTRLKNLLLATVAREGADGIVLSVAEWNGESQDLRDDGYGTVTRYAEFRTISRYASA